MDHLICGGELEILDPTCGFYLYNPIFTDKLFEITNQSCLPLAQ